MKKLSMLLLLGAAGLTTSCVFAIGNEGNKTLANEPPIVTSENGTKFRVAVDDAGNLKTARVD